MTAALQVTRTRLQRLVDERQRNGQMLEDVLGLAEREERDLTEAEQQQTVIYRERIPALETEIDSLVSDLERTDKSRDVSRWLRHEGGAVERNGESNGSEGDFVYRSFAIWARDALITRYPAIAARAGGEPALRSARERMETLTRVPANTLTSDIAGLVPPAHMAQILDLIAKNRPVVASGRNINLSSGKLTYPKIAQRPTVSVQAAEKTETASQKMIVTLEDLLADTYLGAGDLSWQAINWSTPDALALWFDLAAEAYARATETAACTELEAVTQTIATPLGATPDFDDFLSAVLAGAALVYSNTGSRGMADTLYLAPDRFYQAAGLTSASSAQMISPGSLNLASLSGSVGGLRLITSYGFVPGTAIVGDSSALLVGETAGAPVELRAVEPAIGGMEVGVIGAFKAKVFDEDRFASLV